MKFTSFDRLREKLHLKSASRSHSKRASTAAMNLKRKQKWFTRASPMRLTKLYPNMTAQQKNMIKNADFSGLLEIKCSKLQPELCKFLMESFDPTSCAMVFPGRGVIQITEEDVESVLRIPRGSQEVIYGLDPEAIAFMIEEFGIQGSKQPTITALEELLIQTKSADDRYLRLWIAYAMTSVLAPTTGNTVCPRLYPSLKSLDVKKSTELNFCKFVIQILCSAKAKGKNIFKACMLFMMIKYVDSLEIPDLDVCPNGSRVSSWTNEMVKKVMDDDRTTNGSFGNLQLKERYRQSQQMIFGNPLNIELFVRTNTPEGCTSEELSRYKQAVEGACVEFEGVIQRFLRKASGKDEIISSKKRQSPEPRKMRRTKRQRVGQRDNTEHAAVAGTLVEKHEKTSDEEYKCGSNKGHVRSEDVSLENEDANVLKDDPHSSSEDSDFVNNESDVSSEDVSLEIEDEDVLKDDPHSSSEDSDFVKVPKPRHPLGALRPTARRTSDCSKVDQNKHTSAPDVNSDNACIQVAEDNTNLERRPAGALADLAAIYASGSEIAKQVAEEKVEECINVRKPTLGKLNAPLILDMDSSKTSMSIQDQLLSPESQIEKSKPAASAHTVPMELTKMSSEITPQPDRLVPNSKSAKGITKSVSFADQHGNSLEEQLQKVLHPAIVRSETPQLRSILKEINGVQMRTPTPPHLVNRASDILSTVPQGSGPMVQARRGSPESFGGIIEPRCNLSAFPDSVSSSSKKKSSTINNEELVDSVVKVLVFDSAEQSEKKRRLDSAPDAPSFDLNLDGDQEDLVTTPSLVEGKVHLNPAPLRLLTASEVDMYYDNFTPEDYEELAAQVGEKLFPDKPLTTVNTQAVSSATEAVPRQIEEETLTGKSITPVPQEYHKRVVKPAKNQRSPYLGYESKKSFAVSKHVNDVYNIVCRHGWKARSLIKFDNIIDFDDIYIVLADLADSVRPEKKLVNHVAEVAIHILSKENENPRKLIMPLRISGYLIDCRFELKEVQRLFTCAPGNRLDHKESIQFPVLQFLTPDEEEKNGHYFLFTLNIKAQRFEIMDSLRREDMNVVFLHSSSLSHLTHGKDGHLVKKISST